MERGEKQRSGRRGFLTDSYCIYAEEKKETSKRPDTTARVPD